MPDIWTVESVAARFAEAAATAHTLPPVRVQGYFNLWPPIVRSRWEALACDDLPETNFPPSPEAIDRMLEVMRWIQCLEVSDRHLVWIRARQEPWHKISRHLGCDRTTAWRRWKLALTLVTEHLNQTRVCSGIAREIA